MPIPLPKTIDETLTLLTSADYVADRSLATALYLSLAMQRPLFLEGEAGTGKTEIAKVVAFVQRLRGVDLFKLPGVAETIDWANCLVALDRSALDPETVNNTLGVLLKYQDDIERIAGDEAERLVTEAKTAAAAA